MTVSGKPCSAAVISGTVISGTVKSDAHATCDISRSSGSGSNWSAARKGPLQDVDQLPCEQIRDRIIDRSEVPV